MDEKTNEAAKVRTIEPSELANVTHLYANGFALGMTNADVFIVLQKFGKPSEVVSLSYTLAKTLAVHLGELVSDWETKTGRQLATTADIDKTFNKEAKQ